MASLSFNNGRPVIGYADAQGRRRWLRPGRCDRRTADRIRCHVETLSIAARLGVDLPEMTVLWVKGLQGRLKANLVRSGLVKGELPAEPKSKAPRRADSYALGDVFQSYIDRRKDLKPPTMRNLRAGKELSCVFFGSDRDIRTLSKAEGGDYLRHLKAKYANASATVHFRALKQVLTDAVDRNLLERNPLSGVKAGHTKNAERQRYVPTSDVLACIAQCPDAKWRLLFALARFGGLRTPSETHGLRWADVWWEQGKLLVRSPKTERHEGRATRVIPLYPELLPYLRDAFDAAKPGEEYCLQGMTRSPSTTGVKLVKRAGLTPWPKLWQNCRASRQTDLAAVFPVHVACAWMGNTQAVAAGHYLLVTADHYAAAAGASAGADRQVPVSQTVIEREKADPPMTGPEGEFGHYRTQPDSYPLDHLTREQRQQTHLALQKALSGGQSYLACLTEALPHIRRTDIDRLTDEVRAAKAGRGRA